ncbi:MAG: chemotaxis protein CheW [Actinobacteria bacterium]|nr:chemotaxis protein CheW [Actinomycetota bacterium]MCA1720102.1 chemotaxis protein CheW [Actinomycetota bacterium]
MTAPLGDVQLCTFVVGGLLLGLPAAGVSEVVHGEEVTPVPLAPAAVLGLLNLRGRIVPAIDARLRLGMPPRPVGEEGTHIVVRVRGEQVSLVVDRTSDVVSVAAADREDVPETVGPEIRRLLTASHQRTYGLLLVLDPELVLSDT